MARTEPVFNPNARYEDRHVQVINSSENILECAALRGPFCICLSPRGLGTGRFASQKPQRLHTKRQTNCLAMSDRTPTEMHLGKQVSERLAHEAGLDRH